ncbi:hypothetical protein HDR61_04440 [bacterium]|nr:hypothetical protein [bacterium]
MTGYRIFLLAALVGLTGCHRDYQYMPETEYVEYIDVVDQDNGAPIPECTADDIPSGQVKYSVPRDGDLTLETRHHIIQVQGAPGTEYEYRVWAGDKSYNDDPDLIVSDGNIMVLQEN